MNTYLPSANPGVNSRPLHGGHSVAQVGATTMLRPYPSVGDLGLYLSLLLLLQPQLSRFKTGLMLFNSLLLLVVLGPAMWSQVSTGISCKCLATPYPPPLPHDTCQWIYSESANSNFFYSISLLLGAWHTFVLVQVVLSTIGLEEDEEGGRDVKSI